MRIRLPAKPLRPIEITSMFLFTWLRGISKFRLLGAVDVTRTRGICSMNNPKLFIRYLSMQVMSTLLRFWYMF